MDISLIKEARDIIRTQPMCLKVGHLRKCADAADAAYRDLCHSYTRVTAQAFAAHTARLLIAIDMVLANEPTSPSGGRVHVENEAGVLAGAHGA